MLTIIHNVDKFWQIRWSGPLIWGQTQPNPKVMWNILQLTFICVMNFAFILFLTESPLVKLGQFWPHLPSPGWTKCYLIAKSSLQHSIFMKSQKIGNLFFEHFTGNHIWVVFPRTGKMSKICPNFFFFGALLWPNGFIFSSFLNCSEEFLSVPV